MAAELVRVVDGDTIVVRLAGGRKERVRYLGIDTPETVHPQKPVEWMGAEATAENSRLLGSGPLRLVTDVEKRDRYGRLLAYVWAGPVFVNWELVRNGYAYVSTVPPNVRFVKEFVGAQRAARAAGLGLWGSRE
ncbi:MAG: hypothetical protein Kow00122_18940 [Thermoleophilia bacterium]